MFAALMAAQNVSPASSGQIGRPVATGIDPSQIGSVAGSTQMPLSNGASDLGMRDFQQPGIQAPVHDPLIAETADNNGGITAVQSGDTSATKLSQSLAQDSDSAVTGLSLRAGWKETGAPAHLSQVGDAQGTSHLSSKLDVCNQSGARTAGSVTDKNNANEVTPENGSGDAQALADTSSNLDSALPEVLQQTSAKPVEIMQPGQSSQQNTALVEQQDGDDLAARNGLDLQSAGKAVGGKKADAASAMSEGDDSKTSRTGIKENSKKQELTKGVAIAQEQVNPTSLNAAMAVVNPMSNRSTTDPKKTADQATDSGLPVQGVRTKLAIAAKQAIVPASDVSEDKKSEISQQETTPTAKNGVALTQFPTAATGSPTSKTQHTQDEAVINGDVQSASTAGIAVDREAVRPVPGKQAIGKAKSDTRDHIGALDTEDDSQQSVTGAGFVSGSSVAAATPVAQHATASHAQAHTGFLNTEAQKENTSFSISNDKAPVSQVGSASATVLSGAQATKVESNFGARNQQVEVGFHDGTLGWLSVRAASTSENGLHLSVTGRSSEAAAAVDRMLPSLQHFLQEHDVRAHSVTYGSQQSAALPAAAASMASSSFSQDARNASAGDQRSNSPGQQRSSSGSEQQGYSQRERSTQPRAFQAGAGPRYEGSLQENGLLSIRI